MYRTFWDTLAVLAGLYAGWKVFVWMGTHIPAFGYFPLGVIAAAAVVWWVGLLVHGVEFLVLNIEYFLFHSWRGDKAVRPSRKRRIPDDERTENNILETLEKSLPKERRF